VLRFHKKRTTRQPKSGEQSRQNHNGKDAGHVAKLEPAPFLSLKTGKDTMKHVSATSTFVCIFLFFIHASQLTAQQQEPCQGVYVSYDRYSNSLFANYDACNICAHGNYNALYTARCHHEFECDTYQYLVECYNLDTPWELLYDCAESKCYANLLVRCGPYPTPVRRAVSMNFRVVAIASRFATNPLDPTNGLARFEAFSPSSQNQFFEARPSSPWPWIDNNHNSMLYGAVADVLFNDGTRCMLVNYYTLIHG
jgi:hypothetical protein